MELVGEKKTNALVRYSNTFSPAPTKKTPVDSVCYVISKQTRTWCVQYILQNPKLHLTVSYILWSWQSESSSLSEDKAVLPPLISLPLYTLEVISLLLPSHERKIPCGLTVIEATATHHFILSELVVYPVVLVHVSSLWHVHTIKAETVEVCFGVGLGTSHNAVVVFSTGFASVFVWLKCKPMQVVQDTCHRQFLCNPL